MDGEVSYSCHIAIDEEVPLHVGSPNEIEMTDQLQQVPDSDEETEIVHTPDQVNGANTLPESAAPSKSFATQGHLIGRGFPILRVPAHVRVVEKGAYSPKTVIIGPLHRHLINDEPSLRDFENDKERFRSGLSSQMSRSLENAMTEIEGQTRKFYSGNFQHIESGDFVRMMVIDGYFIVELLRLYDKTKRSTKEGNDVEEPIFKTRWMAPNIGRDLLKLENQLPMFVLRKIFDLTKTEGEASLNRLALQFFEPLRPGKDVLGEDILDTTHPHLLALFQSTFISTPKPSSRSEASRDERSKYENIPGKGWVHNATALTYAGVRFEKKSGNFLDIEYNNRKLKIPTLFIDDGTSSLLRNLIAYEQSNIYAEPYFSCLAVFLDGIVDTVDDIKILRDAEIIKRAKGADQEVVDLFNSLTKGLEIGMDDCYILKQLQEINGRYRSHQAWVRFRRALSRINYWGVISTYISAVLTMFSIYFYVFGDRGQPTGSAPLRPSTCPCPCPAST